jgi:hypothetical protein
MVVVRSFCFELNIFSPFILSTKNEERWSPFYIFSPIDKRNMSERIYQSERWWNTGKG